MSVSVGCVCVCVCVCESVGNVFSCSCWIFLSIDILPNFLFVSSLERMSSIVFPNNEGHIVYPLPTGFPESGTPAGVGRRYISFIIRRRSSSMFC